MRFSTLAEDASMTTAERLAIITERLSLVTERQEETNDRLSQAIEHLTDRFELHDRKERVVSLVVVFWAIAAGVASVVSGVLGRGT